MPGVPRELSEHKLDVNKMHDLSSKSSGDLQKIENKL
jgi:hypothetical protein